MPATPKYIAMIGSLGSGFSFHGPFDAAEEAIDFAGEHSENSPWEVAPLNAPGTPTE